MDAKTPTPPSRKRELPKLPQISRRKLLIGIGAGAGLAIGYAVWPRRVPLNLAVREGETLVNAWLKIGADGRVVIAVPQAEMGQGVYTSLPQLLAHELGAEYLEDQANVLSFRVGDGYVVTYGTQVDFRAQPRATFKLLFNGMFHGPSTPVPASQMGKAVTNE